MNGIIKPLNKTETLKIKKYNQIALPRLATQLLCNAKISRNTYEPDFKYTLVYILKQSDVNPDLRYSLRSVEKFCNYKDIWVVGYKPRWIKNVNYLPTVQNGNKWVNSMTNIIAACNCPEISDNFVLMNDDFFILQHIRDWKTSFNICLRNSVSQEAAKYEKSQKASKWQSGFIDAKKILRKLRCSRDFNYEYHGPIILNKQKFLEMLSIPEISENMREDQCFHKRSIYKNLYPDLDLPDPRHFTDTKLATGCDLANVFLHQSFLSVFDGVVDDDVKYPRINAFLYKMFPEKSKYEV